MSTKRTVLFIDAENLFYIQRTLGWEIDFEKLYNFFAEKSYVYNAFYYTAVDREQEEKHKEKMQFIASMGPIGYTVRTKDVKIIKTDSGGTIKKGNMDIELVVDMFNTKDLYQQVILFSGDSDFTRALELLRTHGKEIIVISSKGFASKEIINAADKYVDISKLRKHIEKEKSTTATTTRNAAARPSTTNALKKETSPTTPAEAAKTPESKPPAPRKPTTRRRAPRAPRAPQTPKTD